MKDIKRKIIIFLLLIVIGATSVYAYNLCQARDVVYSPKDTTWDVSNVQEAISDLYKTKCGSANACGDIAEPKFYDDEAFIPVTIDDDGTVRRADTTTSWYDYCEKRWANAVMLNKYKKESGSTSTGITGATVGTVTTTTGDGTTGVSTTDERNYTEIPEYKPGEVIKEEDIQSYFVWIPKYKYKLWNVNSDGKSTGVTQGVHSIDIVFDKTNTTDVEGVSCVTPLTSGESGNCDNGEYMTHPAFITLDVDGFWVGKFESSNADIVTDSSYNGGGYHTNSTIDVGTLFQINYERGTSSKPNHLPVTSLNVKTIFETAYNYARAMDSHMMKNTEWGAVAYLSHSKYGIDKKVNINNSKPRVTGASALPSTNQQTYPADSGEGEAYYDLYNTKIGYLASTTGNISGIYDMSGGAVEYVAAYVTAKYGSSGFNATTIAEYDSKYFDVYHKSSALATFQYRILGDATGEMGPFKNFIDGDGDTTATSTGARYHGTWYRECSAFFATSNSYYWFMRGQRNVTGVLASQFAFQGHSGAAHADRGYRLVLN